METAARKYVVIACCETAIFALGYWASLMFPGAPHWVWLIVAVVALATAFVVWNWPVSQQRNSTRRVAGGVQRSARKAVPSTSIDWETEKRDTEGLVQAAKAFERLRNDPAMQRAARVWLKAKRRLGGLE